MLDIQYAVFMVVLFSLLSVFWQWLDVYMCSLWEGRQNMCVVLTHTACDKLGRFIGYFLIISNSEYNKEVLNTVT